jgi:uncharacterized protein YgiM (DUF1202 family)
MTVYVSSDNDKAEAVSSQSKHQWDFMVPFDDKELRSKLKEQYKVWAMMENGEFGEVWRWDN